MAKFYYNGVLLHEIPSDILAENPYCFIYKKPDDLSTYRLVVGKYKWYCNGGKLYISTSSWYTRYRHEEVNGWVQESSWSDNGELPVGEMLWANHDIPNGSSTSTDVYLKGSESISEDEFGKEEEQEIFYKIAESTLTSFGDQARRISGTTEKLTTAQMLEIFEGAGSGGIEDGYAVSFYNSNNDLFAFNSIKSGQAINPPVYSAKNWVDEDGTVIAFPYIPSKDISLYPDSSGCVAKFYDLYDVSVVEYPCLFITQTISSNSVYVYFGETYDMSGNSIRVIKKSKNTKFASMGFNTRLTLDEIISEFQSQKPTLTETSNTYTYINSSIGTEANYVVYTNITDTITTTSEVIVIE